MYFPIDRFRAYFTHLPPVLGGIVQDATWAAAKQSTAGLLKRTRGVAGLGPIWVPAFCQISGQLHLIYNQEDMLLTYQALTPRLQPLDVGFNNAENRLAIAAQNGGAAAMASTGAAFTVRLLRDATLTAIYVRSACVVMQQFRDSLPPDQLAEAIATFAAEAK